VAADALACASEPLRRGRRLFFTRRSLKLFSHRSSEKFTSEVFVGLDFRGQFALPFVELHHTLVSRGRRCAGIATDYAGDASKHRTVLLEFIVSLKGNGDLEFHSSSGGRHLLYSATIA
jgi:hypothetical protein